MYKIFQTIEDFIKEVYGFNFIKEPMDPKVSKIRELKNAYDTIMRINQGQRKPLPNEFVKYVYPLLVIAQYPVVSNFISPQNSEGFI